MSSIGHINTKVPCRSVHLFKLPHISRLRGPRPRRACGSENKLFTDTQQIWYIPSD
jgi:hypothetical protein